MPSVSYIVVLSLTYGCSEKSMTGPLICTHSATGAIYNSIEMYILSVRYWMGGSVALVSVLNSGKEGPWVQIAAATLSGNSLRQTVHTHCASVHQAAKLVAALLRVAGVTAGLAESNGSLPSGL